MSEADKSTRIVVGPACRPALARHIKLHRDAVRDRWTILAPERVFSPDPIALAVLQLCDGRRTIEDIAEQLARAYEAPEAQILADVIAMLQDLADKGVVTA